MADNPNTIYNEDTGLYNHANSYANTSVTPDIERGSNAEADLGNKQIRDAQKNIAFTKDWYQDKWKNGGLKGKAGAVLSGIADAASGLRGLNFTNGTAGVGGKGTLTGEALQNANEDYRKIGQQSAEDAMGLQKAANQNAANRYELEENVNEGIRYGRELTPEQETAIRNFKNAVGNTGLTDELITNLLNQLFGAPGKIKNAVETSNNTSNVENTNETVLTPEQQEVQENVNKGQSVAQPNGYEAAKERQLLEERLNKRANATDKNSFLETFRNPTTGKYEMPTSQEELEGLKSKAEKWGIKNLEKELKKLNDKERK